MAVIFARTSSTASVTFFPPLGAPSTADITDTPADLDKADTSTGNGTGTPSFCINCLSLCFSGLEGLVGWYSSTRSSRRRTNEWASFSFSCIRRSSFTCAHGSFYLSNKTPAYWQIHKKYKRNQFNRKEKQYLLFFRHFLASLFLSLLSLDMG